MARTKVDTRERLPLAAGIELPVYLTITVTALMLSLIHI